MAEPIDPAPGETKSRTIRRLLNRKVGADLVALQAATGWQPHSVRAALRGLRKAGYGIARTQPTKPGDTATYRIISRPEGQ